MKAALTPAERFTLTQAIASGQVSAAQIEAHYEAGELPVVRLEPSTPSQPVPAPGWSVEIIKEPRRLCLTIGVQSFHLDVPDFEPGEPDRMEWFRDMLTKAMRRLTASQPVPQEHDPIYQYQMANGHWIDQDKENYDYNANLGQAVVRVLYASPQITQPAALPATPLIDLDALGRAYADSYASPHHMTFSVSGLRNLIETAVGRAINTPAQPAASPVHRDFRVTETVLSQPAALPVPVDYAECHPAQGHEPGSIYCPKCGVNVGELHYGEAIPTKADALSMCFSCNDTPSQPAALPAYDVEAALLRIDEAASKRSTWAKIATRYELLAAAGSKT